jgi:hypothetical protein
VFNSAFLSQTLPIKDALSKEIIKCTAHDWYDKQLVVDVSTSREYFSLAANLQ